MKQLLSLVLLAGWTSLSAADTPAEPGGPAVPPKFTCILKKPQDECAFTAAANDAVLSITSATGIGSARLTLTEGDVPRRLALQFPKMRSLEGLAVGDGKIVLNGFQGGDSAFDKDGKAVADPKDAVYFLKISRNKEKDRMEVEMTLPCSEPGTKVWDLSWVDAYRR